MSLYDKDPIDKPLYDLSDSLVRSARLDAVLKKAKSNTEKTIANRSPETIEKQKKFFEKKANDKARLEILSTELRKLKDFLYTSLIKRAEEIGVNEAIKEHATELKIFKEMSDEDFSIRNKHFNYISRYDSLFIELCSANENFALATPNDTLLHLDLRIFDKLDDNQLNILLKKYKSANLIDDANFVKKYMKCFPAMINKITNIDDFTYAMVRHPEYYNQMNKDLRKNITLYAPELKNIIIRNPKVIEYMPVEDIDLVASHYANYIGSVIENNPKVLDYLYPSFFKTHNPKYILNNVNKSKLYPKLEKYFSKFAGLREYFAKSKVKIHPKNEEQNAEINETSGINV